MYTLIALASESELVDFSTPFPFPDTATRRFPRERLI
jgi:hypothetical protein